MNPTELIAEIAQAHDGSLGIAHSYIDTLATAGVDTVKFQMHLAQYESSSHEQFRVNFSYEDATRFDYWKRMEFTLEQWEQLKKHCQQVGLQFLCSPFSIKACEWLKQLGETRIKIASGEIENQLMHDYISTFATEVLISSGMSTVSDTLELQQYYAKKGLKTSVFQCTTAYPTPAEKVGLNVITEFVNQFDCPVGLSDHSGQIYAPLAAVALGASKLEFHAVFNKNMFGPDAKSSLDMEQIAELVKGVRFIETSMHNPVNKTNNHEFESLKNMFGKSLTVNADVSKGTQITKQILETTKPALMGLNPKNYSQIIGKTLNKDLKAHSFINLSDCD